MGVMIEDKIIMKRINEIKPYIRNPRKNEKTVELLCKLIPKVGFNVPLVIDEKGIIVKGHARFAAAIRLGMQEIPCIITHADEDAIKADRITDNKISEFSEWINDEVLQEIESINMDIDFSELGFPCVKFDEMPEHKLPVAFPQGEPEEQKTPNSIVYKEEQKLMGNEKESLTPKKYFKCVCEHCGHVMFVEAGKIRRD